MKLARALGLLAVATMACSRSVATSGAAAPEPDSESTAELETLYHARMDSARMNVHPADVDFMTGMIAHHAQALIMAGLSPERGASLAVQTLSARIINAQQDEIRTMQGWLRERDRPVPEVHIEGLNLMIHGVGEHHHHMPGMLSQTQIEELARAQEAEFDRRFLTFMIAHHQGAVTMVRNLFATDGAALDDAVFKIASDIQVDQKTEIARMQLLLKQI